MSHQHLHRGISPMFEGKGKKKKRNMQGNHWLFLRIWWISIIAKDEWYNKFVNTFYLFKNLSKAPEKSPKIVPLTLDGLKSEFTLTKVLV